MDNKTKIILTVIGLSAVIVPAVFLFFMSGAKTTVDTSLPAGGRQIDKANIEREVNSGQGTQPAQSTSPTPTPTPTPTSSPIIINEGTPSAQ